MQQVSLKANKRQKITKGANRQLRMAGSIPAIIYGGDSTPLPVSLNDREIHQILRSSAGLNVLINLEIGDGSSQEVQSVIIKDIQRDPLKGSFLHIDFYRISMDKELKTHVRIEAVGVAAGVTVGGILEYVMRDVLVQCLPSLIPDKITVDVTPLKIRDSVHIRDLKVPEGVTLLDDPDKNVISIVPPVAEEVAATTTEEITEPEVIERGKKDEEGAEEGAEGKDTKKAPEAKGAAAAAKGAAPAAKGAAPAGGAEKKSAEKKPAEKK